jgi:serine/threonine-protein kinase
VNAPPPAISELRAGLPPAIDGVVARGMAKDKEQRFGSAGELARACAAALGVPGIAPPTVERQAPAAIAPSAPTVLSE